MSLNGPGNASQVNALDGGRYQVVGGAMQMVCAASASQVSVSGLAISLEVSSVADYDPKYYVFAIASE